MTDTGKTTKWVADPAHSEILFKVKHLMITNVKGEFRAFTASIDGADFHAAPIHVDIETASIFTNNNDRDKHLKSADFFDVEKYDRITFQSKSFDKKGEDDYELTGDLTIKGISKEIKLDVSFGGFIKDPYGNEKAGFTVAGKLKRSDWGLTWNTALETGGVMVSEEVKISAEMQFVKQA